MLVLHAWLVLAAAAGPVGALPEDAIGVLAAAPRPGPGPACEELTLQLRDRIAERHPHVVDARTLRERMAGPDPRAAVAEGEAAYEAARAAYARGDYEESVRTLHALVGELERLPDSPELFAQWTRAMLRLARSERSLGHDDASRRCIERLVRAAPELEVDRAQQPAWIASEVARARAALQREPRRALAVASSVPGAEVWVDGRRAGVAPLTIAVPRGRSRVSATHGGLRAVPIAVDLTDADRQVSFDFTAAEAFRPGAAPGLALASGDRAPQLLAAGAQLRLDRVVAVLVAEEGGATYVTASLYDVRRGALVREGRLRLATGSIPVGGTSALAEFLLTGNATSGLVEVGGERRADVPADLRAQPAPVDPAAQALRVARPAPAPRRLGWVALGTGVAALGLTVVGAVELNSAEASYDEARRLRAEGALATSEGVARYNAAVVEGDEAKRAGTVALVGAGAAALGAGIVGYVNYRRTGEFGPFRF